jgi:serine/threonine protein kinase
MIGKGSYGIVVSATDSLRSIGSRPHRTAIKKISQMAAHTVDAKHVLREIRLLRFLGAHENIIKLEDLIVHEEEDALYIVMELMDADLHKVIQSSQELTESHHRAFMHQLLCGMKYMHDHQIIHRDLKPGNLLISRDCRLRITDFGLARQRPQPRTGTPTANGSTDASLLAQMTQHVVTRWYRAPELMLCPDGLYSFAVDVWAAGCIFAELLGRKPLFPGKNFVHQLTLIFDILGEPSADEVAHIRNSQAKRFLASQAHKPQVPFEALYPQASPEAVSLLNQLLVFNPESRLPVNPALDHAYFCGMGPSASTVYPVPPVDVNFDFEEGSITKHELKRMILAEVAAFARSRDRKQRSSSSSPPPSSRSPSGVGASPASDGEETVITSSSVSTHRSDRKKSVSKSMTLTKPKSTVVSRPPVHKRDSHGEKAYEELQGRSPSQMNLGAISRLDRTSDKAMECLSPSNRAPKAHAMQSQAHLPDSTGQFGLGDDENVGTEADRLVMVSVPLHDRYQAGALLYKDLMSSVDQSNAEAAAVRGVEPEGATLARQTSGSRAERHERPVSALPLHHSCTDPNENPYARKTQRGELSASAAIRKPRPHSRLYQSSSHHHTRTNSSGSDKVSAENTKKLTVPKSPAFTGLSWQRGQSK